MPGDRCTTLGRKKKGAGLKPLRVFLDTEFTDFFEPKLISLGLVAASGEECYVEVEFPISECSEFVRDVVILLMFTQN